MRTTPTASSSTARSSSRLRSGWTTPPAERPGCWSSRARSRLAIGEAHDPARLLSVLHRHGVVFVLVGATAAIAQGYPLPTQDTDITPARDPENYERLAAALGELQAKLRTPHGPVEFPIEPRFLAD